MGREFNEVESGDTVKDNVRSGSASSRRGEITGEVASCRSVIGEYSGGAGEFA